VNTRIFQFCLLIAFAVSSFNVSNAQNTPVVVYHGAWGDPRGIDHDWFEHNASTVTHIIHFKIDPLKTAPYMTFDGGEANHSRNRAQIISDAHARGIKVLLCIGGVTKFSDAHCSGVGGADMWDCITADSSLTETVIDAMSNYSLTHGYDGWDLDWESKFNATNLSFLLRRLRAKLNTWPTRGVLSIATGRTPSTAWPVPTINSTCDMINIMLYDGNAYWSCNGGGGGVSGFHEPLHNPSSNYPNYCWDGGVVNSEYCLNAWAAAGIDKSKTNPSIAFYGWSWKGVTAPGQQQSGCSSGCSAYASYADVMSMLAGGGTYHYDNLAQQAWVSLPGATYSYVNYVDPVSVVAKMNYYKANGWNGIMCYSNDTAVDVTKPNGSDAKFPLLTAIKNNLVPPTPAAPSFTSHPAASSVSVGMTAIFSVSAAGNPAPTFQWQKNGTTINGATSNTYTTPATTLGDNGATFRCIATNTQGSAISNTANLTVTIATLGNAVSDDFHDTTASKSLWRFSQPARTHFTGAGTQDAWLVMDIPTGTRLDFWTDAKNAPAAFQNIDNGDFEVVARFQSVSAATYQSEGIVVKQDANTLLRFDCNYGTNGLLFYSGFINGTTVNTFSTAAITGLSGQVWVKVRRNGNTWTGSYSADGITFTQATQFTQVITADSVGVFVANGTPTSGTPPGITCKVDYFFNTSSPLDPEDPIGGGGSIYDVTASGNPIALVTNPTGSGSRNLEVIRNGVQPPLGSLDSLEQYDTFDGSSNRTNDWIGYTFSSPQTFVSALFQEGIHTTRGGYFSGNPRVEVRVGGQWTNVTLTSISPDYEAGAASNFQTYTLHFPPTTGDAIRVVGVPGGTMKYISVGELRVFRSGTTDVTSTEITPNEFKLAQNYPNPFNPSTTIQFQMPSMSHVTIAVFNVLGQKIRTLVDRVVAQGSAHTTWDGKDESGNHVTSGIYLYKMQSGNYLATRKMVFAK
jgi:GH18 family chitinase